MPVETLAPIDTSVPLPPSIKRAAEAADAAHAAAYGPTPGDQPEPTPAPPADNAVQPAATPEPTPEPGAATPQPTPPPTATPQPAPAPAPAPDTVGTAEHEHARYLSMKGRFEHSQVQIGSLQSQLEEMGNELMRTQQLISSPRAQAPTPTPATPLVTEDDVKTYGPELIDVVKRAAREAVQPDLQAVQDQTKQVNQRVIQNAQQGVYAALAEAVPNWQAINNSPEFKRWCALPDIYSGQVRGKLLNEAFRGANAPRVVAFFKGFISDGVVTGQVPVPPQNEPATPRNATIPLETLVAPGRANPATGDTPNAASKPIYTRAQISKFYADVRRGAYEGRANVKAAEEAEIFAAQREGRVR